MSLFFRVYSKAVAKQTASYRRAQNTGSLVYFQKFYFLVCLNYNFWVAA